MKLDESKKTAVTKQWMAEQLTLLEQNKVDASRDEAKQKITSMANNVFKHADEIDRAGKANKTTAAAFNSAFVFYTILKQFGERDEQIVEAAKYCMFKTSDILKALKEGRKPKPGPPGDENDDELNAELNALNADNASPNIGGAIPSPQPNYNNNNNISPSPQQPSQPMNPYGNNNNFNNFNPPQPNNNNFNQPQQPPSNQNMNNMNNNSSGYMVNNAPNYNYQKQINLPQFENKVTACVEAEKTLKEAMAALRFEDVDTAIKKAQEAIAILQPHNV